MESPVARTVPGVVRVAVDSERLERALLAGALGEPLVPVTEDRSAPGAGTQSVSPRVDTPLPTNCRRFRLPAAAFYPDGTPVEPSDMIATLEARLREPASASGWLLAPVEGARAFAAQQTSSVHGLSVDGGAVSICTAAPTPDLAERLRHPDLRLWRRSGVTSEGLADGPGAFREVDRHNLEPNPRHAGPPPLPTRIVRVPADDPGVLLQVGEADVALVYGRTADRLLLSPPVGIRLEPAPAWDRRFAVWLNPAARWLNDPRFRRWLSGSIDRPAMLDYLFAGRGEPRSGLLDLSEGAAPSPVAARPVSELSVPRFELAFDAADRDAERIAARIRALLRAERVEVSLVPLTAAALGSALRLGRAHAAVLSLDPYFDDPLLALREIAAHLGAPGDAALRLLDAAGPLTDATDRRNAALAGEDVLLSDAALVPLVRVHAWLGLRSGLTGVRHGPRRVLDLRQAGWSP